MIKKNQIYLYIFYLSVILLLTILYYFITYYSRMYLATKYDINIPLFLIQEIIPIIFGAALGLDYILKETKKKGQWNFNNLKFLILGVPSLIFFLARLLSLIGVTHPHPIVIMIMKFIFLSSVFFQIFFGYILITSFKKQDYLE